MERRRFNPEGAAEPQLALFDAKPAPGTVQPRRRIALDEDVISTGGRCHDLTDYSRERPPCSGYWELKQRSARAPDGHNWWYSAPLNAWCRGVPVRDSKDAQFVPHATIAQAFEWRGLQKPWPEGYTYDLEKPAFGAPLPLGDMSQAQKAGDDPIPVVSPERLPIVDLNPNRRRIAL